MKKQFFFKTTILSFLFLLIVGITYSQDYEASKTLNKSNSISENSTVKMLNQSGDLKFISTNENTISIKTHINISGKSENDVNKVIKAIENFKFKKDGNEFEIDTRFYKNMQTVNNRRTITLLNGDKIKIKELNISHEIHLPKKVNLKLNNKYSDIEMQSLNGKTDLLLYSSNLNGENIANDIKIEAKYSKINLKELAGDVNLNFYDSDIRFNSCRDAKIVSKYSKFEADKSGKLSVNSYDDKFFIDEISSISLEAKYSDLVSEANISDFRFNLYDCNVKIKSAEKGSFNGKYSDLVLGNTTELQIDNSYDNNFSLKNTLDVQIAESKYSKYEIDKVSFFSIVGYDDNISVKSLNTDFKGILVNTKYGKLNVKTNETPFQVYFNIKYAEIDIPESVKIIKQIKDNSNLELVGNDSGGKISVKGYNIKIQIRE